MTAVPFSSFEQHKIDAAKQHEKTAARLRREAEDARIQRQEAEDKRVDLIALEAELKRKEDAERRHVTEQREKFSRGMATLRKHFNERVGLYDAEIVKFEETRSFSGDSTIITIHLRRKP